MSVADALPREELLKAGSGRAGSWPLALTKWVGRSKRSYVASIWLTSDLDPADLVDAVVIAVRRDGLGNSKGIAQAVRVTLCPDVATARGFLAVLPRAITELHLHRTEPDAKERTRIVADLQPE